MHQLSEFGGHWFNLWSLHLCPVRPINATQMIALHPKYHPRFMSVKVSKPPSSQRLN